MESAFEPWSILRTYGAHPDFIGIERFGTRPEEPQSQRAPHFLGATFGAVAFVLVIGMLIWHGADFRTGGGESFGTKHTTKIVDSAASLIGAREIGDERGAAHHQWGLGKSARG